MKGRCLGVGGAIAAIAVILGCGGDGGQVAPSPSSTLSATPVPASAWADGGVCDLLSQPPDGVVLATGLLSRASTDPVIPRDRLDPLSQEIEGMLARIRSANPRTEGIHATPDYALVAVTVGLDPELLGALKSASDTGVDTGYAQFDKLNQRLGLVGWRTSPYNTFAVLCFSRQVNVRAAAAAYERVAGVRSAEIEPYGYIPEVVPNDIEIDKDGDTWYAVLRTAGTMFPTVSAEVYFFTVTGDTVTAVPPSEAASNGVFARLALACTKEPCKPD